MSLIYPMRAVSHCIRRLAVGLALAIGGTLAQAQTPPASINLGGLVDEIAPDYQLPTFSTEVTLGPGQVQWFSFTVTQAITNASGRYLDINTYPSSIEHVDTTLGLYNSEGNRIALDADGGGVFYSQLSFGLQAPARGPVDYGSFFSREADGVNGPLTSGTYYLAVSRFTSSFGATDFDVTSSATGTDTFQLQFRGQAIPEPSTVALVVMGVALAILQIRRRSRAA